MLLDSDLTEFPGPLARLRREEYALGASFPGTVAVISLHRLRTLTDPTLQGLALARLVRHHLGHVLAIPPFERREQVLRRGLEMHCTNLCVMRHADTLEQLANYAVQEAALGWPFCPLCTQALHSVVLRHAQEWN